MPQRAEADLSNALPYGPDPMQRLVVCSPHEGSGSRPALLFLHGAGGGKFDFAATCRLAASHGIVGILADYRTADGAAAARWPAQLEDAQSAVAWVRAHAAEYRIDPARICALGGSFGGFLAVSLAVLNDHPAARVACAIDQFGPVDLTRIQGRPAALPDVFGPADPETLRRKAEQASPLRLVSAKTAPILIIQGTADPYVRPDQSQDLYQALLRAGVQTRLITYAGGHGFAGLSREQRAAIIQAMFAFVLTAPPRP